MPVTTRAQSRRLRAAEPQLARKLHKTVRHHPTSKISVSSEQPYVLKGTWPSVRMISQASNDRSSPQAPSKPISPSRQIPTEPALSDLYRTLERQFWPCHKCSCPEGVFEGLINSCVRCEHTMDDHEPHHRNPWYPGCDYLCKRENLVISVLQHTRKFGVMVIRATPMVGKTALLQLLGHHIVYNEPDLEPVYLIWENKEKRKDLPYGKFLQKQEVEWQQTNMELRPHNPDARTIYLIDEAQGSYEEEAFWSMLKNYHNTRTHPLFVLVCVYGAAGISHIRDPNIESQAQRMHSLQRVELRPSQSFRLCMLFRQEDVDLIVRKFAVYNDYQLGQGVSEYIYSATDGHPGMVGLLLSHISNLTKTTRIHIPPVLTREIFHNLLVQHEDSFVEWLGRWGRGVWSPYFEAYVHDCLRHPLYKHVKFLDIKKALREVALQSGGLTRTPVDFDAFACCHKWGLLHTEQSILGHGEVTFTFASPLHRRVAYRRLFPGREPDAILENVSLQQICTNAIARFSPAALQNRQCSRSNTSWSIPEATFQAELYCCLSLELHYLPILSQYSHTKDGRIDFYISHKKWGIEILQSGSNAELAKHMARFATGGNYQTWDIMDDYIILNFCPRSALRSIKVPDQNIQSHVFHVVIEPGKLSAEIYTHDKQLYKSWSLSEGRQRNNSNDFLNFGESFSDAESEKILTPDGSTESEEVPMEELRKKVNEQERVMKEQERVMKEQERVIKELQIKQ